MKALSRFIALGEYDNAVPRVVSTLRDGDVRIISAWRASRHDRKADATVRVRFDSLDDMPPAAPLSPAFKALTDDDVERRAAGDPDAGAVPAEFWDTPQPVEAETEEQITLRLDRDVLTHFPSTGKG